MLFNDKDIAVRIATQGMIRPAVFKQVRESDIGEKLISYGLSSVGYDLRLSGEDFRIFSPVRSAYIDPKNFDDRSLIPAPVHETDEHEYFLLPPHTYALGLTLDRFSIPDDVMGVCIGKSTYARCGLVINTTPLEPGWVGQLVLEMANTASLPIRVYIGEGIAQCLFFRTNERPDVTYGDRNGKYQNQQGLTGAKV